MAFKCIANGPLHLGFWELFCVSQAGVPQGTPGMLGLQLATTTAAVPTNCFRKSTTQEPSRVPQQWLPSAYPCQPSWQLALKPQDTAVANVERWSRPLASACSGSIAVHKRMIKSGPPQRAKEKSLNPRFAEYRQWNLCRRAIKTMVASACKPPRTQEAEIERPSELEASWNSKNYFEKIPLSQRLKSFSTNKLLKKKTGTNKTPKNSNIKPKLKNMVRGGW